MPTPTYLSGYNLIRSELNDGGLSLAVTGSRPSILIAGPASEGPTNFPQLIVEQNDVKRLYGADTEMQKKVAEIIAQAGSEAYFIYVMRVGGISPKFKLTSPYGGSITLTPLHYHDKEAGERLKFILKPHMVNGVEEQRVIIYDSQDEAYIWDSHSILDILERPFYVEIDGVFADSAGSPMTHGISSNGIFMPNEILVMADHSETYYSNTLTSDYSVGQEAVHSLWKDTSSGNGDITVTIERQGNDGLTVPLVQRYVFLDRALESLGFREFDYILACGGYFIDAPNIADSVSSDGKIVHHELQGSIPVHTGIDFSVLPTGTQPSAVSIDLSSTTGDPNNILGWLWQTEYEGNKFYYMAAKKGWELFEAVTETVTMEVPAQEVSFSVASASDSLSFALSLSFDYKVGGVVSIAIAEDNAAPITASLVSYTANALSIVIGTQGATLGDIKNWVENSLEAAVNVATSLSGTITPVVAGPTSAANLIEAVSIFTALGITALTATGSISFDVDFDDAYDPYQLQWNHTGSSIAETTVVGSGQKLVISFNGGSETLSALETALNGFSSSSGAFTISNVAVAGDVNAILTSAAIVSGSESVIDASAATGGNMLYHNNFLDHEELTGEPVPAEVEALFQAALGAEFRECSFAHQMATFCHKSSSTFKTVMTCMTFQGPENSWGQVQVGSIPVYTSIAGKLAIDTATDGGKGLLGYKFSAGAPGYRNQILGSIASSNDGYAYGGLILTLGNDLPEGIEPYGIADGDEAKDEKGYGVDIGKYIVPCAMWVTHSNAYDQYVGDLTGTIAAMIGITPIGSEPIGPVNGALSGIKSTFQVRYNARIIGKLASAGFATVAFSPGRGVYINNLRTLAHRYSDYRKVSTIRAVNRVVQGVRNLAQDYIGLAYNSANVASLRTAINGYLRSEQTAKVHNGAVAQISFSRQDRMLGNITIRLTMVPPYAIESINVVTSLIADESNLQ